MVESSSRPRWRKIAAWTGIGLGVAGLISIVALVTAPAWGAGRIEAELEQRASRRLHAQVEIAKLDASWSGAVIEGVSLSRDGVELRIEQVEIALDRSALWSGRIEVVEVQSEGGSFEGTRAGVEGLVEDLRELERDASERDQHGWLRRRTRLTPKALSMRGLAFSVSEREGGAQVERRATGSLAATVEPAQRRVELEVTNLVAELGLGRPLRASSVETALAQIEGELVFPIRVEVEGVSAQIDENIAVAGVHGTLTAHDRSASQLSIDLAGGFADASEREGAGAGQDLWSVSGSFPRDLSSGTITVDMERFELGRVPEVLARLPLVDSERATVGGHLEIDFGSKGGSKGEGSEGEGEGGIADIDGKLELEGLNVSHRLLAREVVRDVGFGVEIDAKVDVAARRLSFERLSIQREGVELVARGELVHPAKREHRRYVVEAEVPAVGCQQVLDAIPHELVPGLAGFELEGQFDAHLTIDADFADLDALKLEGDIGIDGCRVVAAPRLASVDRLDGAFVHRVTMRDGRTRRVGLYAGSSSFTRLDEISRYMVEAVLTTEDGGFRRHDGFNRSQLEVALRRNLQQGKVRLGASTITMQMVKNVLLSHERTLSRKLQELFLTWWVEQALGKQRIMELYLNVIEFGPGIYGVTNASRHYFAKHPGELTSLEAAYLAAMLPSPVRRHVHYCNGGLDERFANKVAWIHDLMLERERITAIEHAAYAGTPLRFDLLDRGDPELCLAEIETIMAGTNTQRALSGLLGDGADDDLEGWGATEPSRTWGVRPPLPDFVPVPPDGLGPSELPDVEDGVPRRLEPVGQGAETDWMDPGDPVDADPAASDAPGRPAMDE